MPVLQNAIINQGCQMQKTRQEQTSIDGQIHKTVGSQPNIQKEHYNSKSTNKLKNSQGSKLLEINC